MIKLLYPICLLSAGLTSCIDKKPSFSNLLVYNTNTNTIMPEIKTDTATLANGCFWCTEAIFEELNGVISATSGYSGGHEENPTYKQVCSGETGHAECLQIVYDPAKISFDELLGVNNGGKNRDMIIMFSGNSGEVFIPRNDPRAHAENSRGLRRILQPGSESSVCRTDI